MKQIDLFNIKLNHIRIFLTAVERGSFSKAAVALHVTQPMVTKTIQALENELELILFLREKGRLRLTPAGRELYVQWTNLMQYFENSIEDANALQEGILSRIVIGIGYHTPDVLLDQLTSIRRNIPENIRVHFVSLSMADEWEQLRDGSADLILVSGHTMPEELPAGLESRVLVHTNLAVFIPKDNPLSKKDQITFADLRNEEFIAFSSNADAKYLSLLNRLGQEAGFTPRIACYVPDEASFRVNLRMNNGIVFADSHMGLEDHSIRKYVLPLENNLVMVWRRQPEKKELQQIVDALADALKEGYSISL